MLLIKLLLKGEKNICHCLVYFVSSVSIVDPTAENKCGLPTGKVDRLICYGGLKYANFQFFQFVVRLEMVYSNIFSEEYIVAIGPNIVDRIRVSLKKETDVTVWLAQFIAPDTKPKCFDELVNFLLMIYSRMRGKDFAMKLLKKMLS